MAQFAKECQRAQEFMQNRCFLLPMQRYNKNKLEMCNTVQYCAVLNYFPNATLNGFMPRVPSRNIVDRASTWRVNRASTWRVDRASTWWVNRASTWWVNRASTRWVNAPITWHVNRASTETLHYEPYLANSELLLVCQISAFHNTLPCWYATYATCMRTLYKYIYIINKILKYIIHYYKCYILCG